MQLLLLHKNGHLFVISMLLFAAISSFLLATAYPVLAFLPIVFLWSFFVLFKRPDLGFLLIVFMIPLENLREIGMFDNNTFSGLTLSKLIGIALIIIYSFYFLLNKVYKQQIETNLWTSIFFLTFAAIISVVFSNYQTATLASLKQYATVIVFFVLTLLVTAKDNIFTKISYAILLGVGISAFLAIVGFFFEIPLLFMSSELKRGLGGMQNPNHLGSMIVFALPFALHFSINSKNATDLILKLSLSLILIISLILTYSRGAFIVASCLILLMLWEYRYCIKPKLLGFIIACFMIIASAGMMFVPQSYWQRQQNLSSHDSSIQSRLSYLTVGWEAIKQHPMIGSGLGSFPTIYANSKYAHLQAHRRTRAETMRAAHNTYLEILIGTGIVGFIPFLCLIGLTISNFKRAISVCFDKGLFLEASLFKAYKLAFYSVLLDYFFLSSPYSKFFWLSAGCSFFALIFAQRGAPLNIKQQ